jgi:hypothetical protein
MLSFYVIPLIKLVPQFNANTKCMNKIASCWTPVACEMYQFEMVKLRAAKFITTDSEIYTKCIVFLTCYSYNTWTGAVLKPDPTDKIGTPIQCKHEMYE